MAGNEFGVAKPRVAGGLTTRGDCSRPHPTFCTCESLGKVWIIQSNGHGKGRVPCPCLDADFRPGGLPDLLYLGLTPMAPRQELVAVHTREKEHISSMPVICYALSLEHMED